jgi:hypothetical protein
MENGAYLSLLAALDPSSPSAVRSFIVSTQSKIDDPLPKPIPLGTNNNVAYFLQSCTSAPNLAEIGPLLPTDAASSGFTADIWEYRGKAINGLPFTRPGLRWGLCLGTLQYQLLSVPNTALVEDTNFYIIFNIVDKSLWMVFDFHGTDAIGEQLHIDPAVDTTWGRIPSSPTFQAGAMRIVGGSWASSKTIPAGDPFADRALMVNPPILCEMLAGNAKVKDIADALKTRPTLPAVRPGGGGAAAGG